MDKAIKTPNRTGILVRALIVLAMCGIVNSAAVFVSPMAKHFGWTTEAIAGVATYMAFMQTPGHILSGWLLGKIGAKKTLFLGCILLGLAFLLSGMVPSGSPWMLYITFSVLQGLGVGFTYTGSTYCATGWYPDKRGFASGLCMAFNGGSATFLAPLIVKLIGSIGIIVTLYIVGGAIIVIGICAAIGLKSAPVGYAPAGWKAKADDPKLGYRKVYTICGICSVASSLCLMFAHSLAMFYIAYVLLAVGFGATNCCHPVAVQETYGSKYAGGIFGICMLGYMIICTFISPKISSALVKATGSYTASMIYAIIACIIAVAVYTTIPMPKRRTLAEVAAEEKAAQEKAAQA